MTGVSFYQGTAVSDTGPPQEENVNVEKKNGTGHRWGKYVLALVNVVLILSAVAGSLQYSSYLGKKQETYEKETFCSTVESMKQISANYLRMEQGYVRDWASYISQNDLTIGQALAYIRQANAQKDKYAHIVDMATYEAHSTYVKNGSNEVKCYSRFRELGTRTDRILMENMQQMFDGDNDGDGIHVLGKYRSDEAQVNVISVGTKVSIRQKNRKKRDYLLLRIIPVESMRSIWVFPMEYQSAEIGIITQSGAYVIPSQSMKSVSFIDLIRGYNFEDDYNRAQTFEDELMETESGLLVYKDSKNQPSYWYYSRIDEKCGMDILGYIPVESLSTHTMDWTIVRITCLVLGLLAVLDGWYFLHINRRLRETARIAEHASLAKTRFLSTMSHDIRTPMNAIIGMTDIAKANCDSPAKVRSCLDKVSLASSHLLTLINDVLDISKVESGSMVLNPAPFSIRTSTDRLISIIRPQIEEKKISLQVDIGPLPFEYVVADELRLNQIYMNLLTNAVKYTGNDGNIHMVLWEETAGDDRVCLIFEVEDNGIGMSQEFQQNMYTLFSGERDGRIDNVQGSGLGLAIVKQMTDLMDGTVQCDSRQGEGSRFTVSIEVPVADRQWKPENNGEDYEEPDEETAGTRILVAEDNDMNWEILEELLVAHNIHCERAVDGRDCVDKLERSEEGTYDLVLMDVQMPVMNGKEAARKIRKSVRRYVREIPVIAVTADAFAEDMQECIDAGMNGHISKPIDMKKVIAVIRSVRKRGEK